MNETLHKEFNCITEKLKCLLLKASMVISASSETDKFHETKQAVYKDLNRLIDHANGLKEVVDSCYTNEGVPKDFNIKCD